MWPCSSWKTSSSPQSPRFRSPKSNTVLPDPVAKLVPVIVTDVPPTADPEEGLTAVTVGVGGACHT